jgi:hypothetical protein
VTEVTDAGVGLIALVAAILIWTIGHKHTPRLVLALVITSSICSLGTRLGRWIEDAMRWINGLMGTALGWLFGATFVGLIAFVCAYIIIIDLRAHGGGGGGRGGGGGGGSSGFKGFLHGFKGHNVSDRTLAAGAMLPFSAIALPGMAGLWILTLLGWVSGFVAWGIDLMFR